ncbi:hypothetical protein PBV87_12130 [Niameybacter massiliensis]|uniref:Uncharacterized protein n=1 Tax=Holtiella tumoricola TaxID=3018743 RepID=A0AA42DNE6_9FIRM|nr:MULTISPECIES: hypothetical protein [Lachnospirales]MDA3732233.1 hypothetical protein [Holtiella tumoricola]
MRKSNREKFKEMNTKQKVGYIWEYYRYAILGTIIGIFLVSQIVTTMLKPKDNFDAHVVVTSKMVIDSAKMEEEEQFFKENFNTDLYYLPADWSQMDSQMVLNDQLMMLKIQVREVDIFAMSEDRYSKYMEIEGFDPFLALDEVPEMAPLLEQYKDSLLTATSLEDGKEHVYGIKVDKLEHLEGGITAEPLVISLISVPKNINKAVEIIDYLI